VFERRGGGQVQDLSELADELPGVQGIEQVDVPGGAVQDLEGEPGRVAGVDARGRLIGVDAVAEGERRRVQVSVGNGVRP
jgi:hypothetical protein